MKKLTLLLAIALPLSLVAKKESVNIEVKEGEGPKATLTPSNLNPKSKNTHIFPYVCYEKRIKVRVGDDVILKYKGCFRVDAPCKEIGRAHFGKYPNDYESFKALQRCINATPKFVD